MYALLNFGKRGQPYCLTNCIVISYPTLNNPVFLSLHLKI